MQGPTSRAELRFAPRARAARRRVLHPLAAGLALLAGGEAWSAEGGASDPNPYYIGVTAGVTHDTNVNREAGGQSDNSYSTGLVGGVDQMIGRQHVYGAANVSYNRYRGQSDLDNTSYSLSAGLDWQTVARFSGSLYGSASQGLASLSNNLVQNTSGGNKVRSEQIGTRVNWGGNSYFSIEGGYGFSRTNFSDPSLQASGSHNSTADIGLYYHPGPTVTLGAAVRYTRSSSDNAALQSDGTYLSNSTNGRNLDLSVNWRATAQTGVNARVSFTRQSSSVGGDGFSGLTGALGVTYAPTGKLSFTGQYNRDASTNGSFYNTFNGTTSQSSVGLAESSAVSDSFNLGSTYAATAKVSVNASLSYRRTTQDRTPGSAIDDGYHDRLTQESLGASWQVQRYWSLGCNISHVKRNIDSAFGGDYSGTSYGCSTQITLR